MGKAQACESATHLFLPLHAAMWTPYPTAPEFRFRKIRLIRRYGLGLRMLVDSVEARCLPPVHHEC